MVRGGAVGAPTARGHDSPNEHQRSGHSSRHECSRRGGMTHSRVAEDADVRLTAPFQIEGQHQPNHGSGCVWKCARRFISTLRGVDAG